MPELIIDQSRRCVYLNGQELQLSPQEYRVLHCLGRNNGEVVAKNDLLAVMWSTAEYASNAEAGFNPAAVDLVIFRLRKKLGDPVQSPLYLETRRGFGYILHHARIMGSRAIKRDDQPILAAHRSEPGPPSPDLTYSTPLWLRLTRQEWHILLLLGDEQATRLTNKALAQQLQMAEGTLKKHLQHIYRKLGVENRSGAALLAMRVKTLW
ncbi:MAG: winged helix-turn-helix domain-containing protein, partial [Chloroflexota bacterium]|nr:winged helix-turn-helix domain-containing protein [Chloroflexota bacterium]